MWTLNSNTNSQKKRWVTVSNAVNSARILATTDSGETWISTDSGTTWTLGVFDFKAVAGSTDGSKLVRVVYGGGIWLSTDYGYTWRLNVSNAVLQNQLWNCVASSYDGRVLVAGVYNGGIWHVDGFGVTWTQNTNPILQNLVWSSVASNSNGTTLVATVYGGGIFTSNDYGVIWKNGISAFKSMACSSNGVYCMGCMYGVGIYYSSNSGNTWTLINNLSSNYWVSVTCSADGSIFYVASDDNYVYLYQSGWYDTLIQNYSPNGKFTSITCDSTGTYVKCAAYNGQIWAGVLIGTTVTWNATKVNTFYGALISIAISNSFIYGVPSNGIVYYSANNGYNWNNINAYNNSLNATNDWTCITCDVYGKQIYATNTIFDNINNDFQSGFIWKSNDYGNSWNISNDAADTLWTSIVCDKNGSQIVATFTANIYTYTSFGEYLFREIQEQHGTSYIVIITHTDF
jgi:hypothetical protein